MTGLKLHREVSTVGNTCCQHLEAIPFGKVNATHDLQGYIAQQGKCFFGAKDNDYSLHPPHELTDTILKWVTGRSGLHYNLTP